MFKFVTICAMKAYRGSRGIPPLIPNLDTRQSWVVKFTHLPLFLGKGLRYLLNRRGEGWASETLWSICKREKYVASAGTRSPDRPSVTIPTAVSRMFSVMRVDDNELERL
jgi:hypothetical protein